ncbi:Pimeloyl-ACP methyl ester carboxylesterase [Streptomyces sp. DvalAA-14]|uniref:alpha/beta fold hydrolase n=1 Tax=unclassified Streptomyces TaxID=2593676 RepID=UPI00081B529D|nr:alpha/beta hydrolase [Streptomyces sp. DvalAA-14]MYS25052.1 alpha/beta fold hydrolase [Streptomyces sp. SID4948]SCE51666.1 Pimeloyl-ACP methyl ester carboxylesterase [Streptomyces sp. DvalAA-14]
MSTPSSTLIRPQFRTIDGLSVRFAEGGQGRQDAILLSPWPESVLAFEQVWAQLGDQAHLIAVDPPGFGQSERRDELMNPQAMGDFIIRVADAFGLENPHLVGPDIGTSSTLFAAAAQPGRFRSLFIGSGGAAVPLQLAGVLKEWVEAPDVEPYRRMDGRDIVSAALSTIEGYTPSPEIREDYLSSYEGDRFLHTLPYARAYPDQLPVLAELLPGIETPVSIVQGRGDQVVPSANAEFLHSRLPHSRVDLIDGAGHFCWEEKPDAYAALVTAWWNQGYTEV